MALRRHGCAIGALALVATLAACGRFGGHRGGDDRPAALTLRFEDRAEPAVFERKGVGVRDGPKGSAGLWAAVRDLPRPERARVVNPATGAATVVALFAEPSGDGPDIRLSNDAADALGIADRAAVEITALRREPEIGTTKGRF